MSVCTISNPPITMAMSLVAGVTSVWHVFAFDSTWWPKTDEDVFNLLPYRSLVVFFATLVELYVSIPLVLIYVQVFRGVVSLPAHRRMVMTVKVTSSFLILAALCVFGWNTVLYMDMYRQGFSQFDVTAYSALASKVWVVYVFLGVVANVQMAMLMIAVAALRRVNMASLARISSVGPTKRGKAPLQKLDILPWLYTGLLVAMGVVASVGFGAYGSLEYSVVLSLAINIASILQYTCLSLLFYPLKPALPKGLGGK
ncbi:hypothetical protein KIPB_001588 [Kipferlia bialata]|uniref:Uncharacterized protein n=1 Tax=Kipferlia bialata TaxID=797122 RepID=A0A9K3CP38_9EUKA|nr:hypothetical protein KIPB_001588 [Kipferlia bialata]|eukprot:g1588.t1